jgi:hypothetical protein
LFRYVGAFRLIPARITRQLADNYLPFHCQAQERLVQKNLAAKCRVDVVTCTLQPPLGLYQGRVFLISRQNTETVWKPSNRWKNDSRIDFKEL